MPRVHWVHVDDRLGYHQSEQPHLTPPTKTPHQEGEYFNAAEKAVGSGEGLDGANGNNGEEEVVKALRESCFMMITGAWMGWWAGG